MGKTKAMMTSQNTELVQFTISPWEGAEMFPQELALLHHCHSLKLMAVAPYLPLKWPFSGLFWWPFEWPLSQQRSPWPCPHLWTTLKELQSFILVQSGPCLSQQESLAVSLAFPFHSGWLWATRRKDTISTRHLGFRHLHFINTYSSLLVPVKYFPWKNNCLSLQSLLRVSCISHT